MKRDVLTLWFAMRHPQTPAAPKLLAAFAAAYALSPIDLIPDFIPVIGLLDDVILVPLMVAATVKMIPDAVIAECRERAARHIADSADKPVSIAGLGIVLTLWVGAACLAWRLLA
jgi:uncharacterized membrane protein YkvA (DUF1232 family)